MLMTPAIPIAIMTSTSSKRKIRRFSSSVAPDDAVLRERRVQVDDVRHHGRAEDPDREQDALRARRSPGRSPPATSCRVRLGEEDLEREGADDDADERRDDGLEPAEAACLQREDRRRPRHP